MAKHYELTPSGLLAIEIRQPVEDAHRILHSLRRYAESRKQNAIVFKKNGDIIFVKVRRDKNE
jgi:hypothetical protein